MQINSNKSLKSYFAHIALSILTIASTSVSYAVEAEPQRMSQSLGQIINPKLHRNYTNPAELNRVAAWLKGQMQSYGLDCVDQIYAVDTVHYKNVVCHLDVAAEDKVIIGAHYDVHGDSDGADDNASGVAGVLETARLLAQQSSALKHNLEFVFYTLEEPPYFRTAQMGSAVHAESILAQKQQISAVYILEMIGYFDPDPVQRYPKGLGLFYPKHGNFIAAVSNFQSRHLGANYCQSMQRLQQLDCQRLIAPAFVSGVDFSDHLNYWKHDIAAIMITDTAFFRNQNYHTPGDTLATLDVNKMAQVVNGLVHSLLKPQSLQPKNISSKTSK
ncbi:peptidase M28-like protein [Acinetobacter calcoaceticus]|uniref:Peptidase M28-like protein n=1 Tax=Acinetobacter calcoaceticus TaxID=471 RepID=A0A4R1Y9V4_ACICA|nr:peptidase M28-like protein [Acinetobacter calcoaceticus]